ncbi:hypothetical protein AB4Z52_30870 [Rhizobium sp. 2YAF20]|uniref:hypothetical protein n=1 Tax=Rhizobium sp. 2YAF20 TaxID=3233027 RepID=UPI003F975884
MTRDEYERDVCARSGAAVDVPFKPDVFIGNWKPKVAECHANVDYWVAHHAGYAPVCGWLCYASFGPDSRGYTAHSVLRHPNGGLVDITPVEDRNFVHRWFIEHLGDDTTFLEMRKDTLINLTCQGNFPAPPLDPMWALQLYEREPEEGL